MTQEQKDALVALVASNPELLASLVPSTEEEQVVATEEDVTIEDEVAIVEAEPVVLGIDAKLPAVAKSIIDKSPSMKKYILENSGENFKMVYASLKSKSKALGATYNNGKYIDGKVLNALTWAVINEATGASAGTLDFDF